jgi:HEAT repeat protein
MDWLTGGRTGEARRLISQLADPLKRERASGELVRLGAEAAPALVESLGSRDASMRALVSKILVQIGAPAIPVLSSALATAAPEIRSAAAQVLGSLGEKQAVPALLDALRGEYFAVRAAAAGALGTIRDGGVIPELTSALKDPEPEVRAAAVAALGEFATHDSLEAIANLLLDDPELMPRQKALQALVRTRREDVIPYLMEALRDSFWWYEREQAVAELMNAIANMGSATVPPLIEALGDAEGTVRRLAATLLGRLQDSRALEPLGMALYDTHFDVCQAAAESLAQFGRAALPLLLGALAHPEAWIRQQAIIGLVKIQDAQVAPALLVLLNDENRDVRKQAIQALGELREKSALAALQELAGSRVDREMAALAKQAIQAIRA